MKANTEDQILAGRLIFEPLTERNWEKFVELFGPKGASGNCWCMFYRLTGKDFKEGTANDGNKNAMGKIVRDGKPAGLLGFYEGQAVAWCALAPREDFIRIERSRVHKRIDDKNVWSIPCFFIHKKFRRSGLSSEILKGAINYARENGVKILEAYPLNPKHDRVPEAFAWYGLMKTFERVGFEVADNKSNSRPMVRFYVDKNRAQGS